MKQVGIEPDVVTWYVLMDCLTFNRTALISAYGQQGETDKVLELFQQMKQLGIKANVNTWYMRKIGLSNAKGILSFQPMDNET